MIKTCASIDLPMLPHGKVIGFESMWLLEGSNLHKIKFSNTLKHSLFERIGVFK